VVSFFEQRAAILRDLDEANLIRRFHVEDERVGVKVKDGLHHLIFTPEHLEIAALTPELDMVVIEDALRLIWGRLEPAEVRRANVDIRFLTAVDGGYDEVRQRAADQVTRWPSGVLNIDSAVSVDIRVDELGSDAHIEFGIVEPREAAQRLVIGQPAVVADAGIAPTIFPLKSLPEVGIFDHQIWELADLNLKSKEEVIDLWSRLRDRAQELDVSISSRLLGESK
jgi:hypothetical protein